MSDFYNPLLFLLLDVLGTCDRTLAVVFFLQLLLDVKLRKDLDWKEAECEVWAPNLCCFFLAQLFDEQNENLRMTKLSASRMLAVGIGTEHP